MNSSNTLSQPLIEQIHLRIDTCYMQAELALKRSFPRPKIELNQRGKIAGCALLQKNTLRFHPLIYQQNQQHFLQHVVAHEIAHLLVWQLFGRTPPHGLQWQQVMVDVFNLPPSRTHQYNVDNIGIKTVLYRCNCNEIPLSMHRHNKVLKGTIYCCRRCKTNLTKLLPTCVGSN